VGWGGAEIARVENPRVENAGGGCGEYEEQVLRFKWTYHMIIAAAKHSTGARTSCIHAVSQDNSDTDSDSNTVDNAVNDDSSVVADTTQRCRQLTTRAP